MERRSTNRTGFTAIELLIVLAIVSLLGALAASAVFRVRASSERTATETTLTKLASALDVHWKVVIDQARKEFDALPATNKQKLIELADNQTATAFAPKPHPRRDDRARLLYLKFRLKQEFPTSFAIAKNPDPTGQYLPTQNVPQVGVVTGKPAYAKAVNPFLNLDLAKQSSAMLVLALQQPRGGVTAMPVDQLVGSNFMRTENGLAYLVDSWGNPLQFFAFPAYPSNEGPSTSDLDVAVPIPTGKTLQDQLKNQVVDPQDPEGLLVLDPNSKQQWNRQVEMANLLHPQFPYPAGRPQQLMLRKMVPIIVSAGPDGNYGGKPAAAGNPFMRLAEPGSFDNIYSYRLRQTGARGD